MSEAGPVLLPAPQCSEQGRGGDVGTFPIRCQVQRFGKVQEVQVTWDSRLLKARRNRFGVLYS